jgi:fatty-acyl-CoA synthase
MFHANAWGLPFDAMLTGAKIVFPGPDLSPGALLDLMAQERVTLAGGVPTIWMGILALLDNEPARWDLSAMRTMLIGGSAAPPSMIDGFRERHGLTVTHAWGMTETNPLGSIARVKRHMQDASDAEKLAAKSTQGYPVAMIEIRHVNDAQEVLPRDGKTMGELEVRGPWVAASYYNNDEQADRFTPDGWFKTGDIVTIDDEGYIRITDRSKDVVKSGGEWISSVELENALMAHPAVLEAAVFAARHERWDERPLAAIVLRQGKSVTRDELTEYLAPNFAKFWLPDDYVFIDEIPKTSVGKFQKLILREQFGEHLIQQGRAT